MLRKLELKDAPLMLEWMHDEDVIKGLQAEKFRNSTIDTCEQFIKSTWEDEENLHLAIIDDKDEYMGTVSLKHIDKVNSDAEIAIAMRSKAIGKGIAKPGYQEIIRIGHEELGLTNIIWYVKTANERCLRFQDKQGYERIVMTEERWLSRVDSNEEYIWYRG